jgi:hypothetical protein
LADLLALNGFAAQIGACLNKVLIAKRLLSEKHLDAANSGGNHS